VDVNTSVEDALRYYDQQTGSLSCNSCGKRPFEVEGWVEGRGASICRACIDEYHRAFNETHSGKPSIE
jgi:hypothetical protein